MIDFRLIDSLSILIYSHFQVSPNDQRLYREGKMLDDNHTLADCGFTSGSARAQQPACVGLAIRGEGEWHISQSTINNHSIGDTLLSSSITFLT